LEELSGERARRLGALFNDRLAEKAGLTFQRCINQIRRAHAVRRLLNKVFSPGGCVRWSPTWSASAISSSMRSSAAVAASFVSEFAFPLPGIVISDSSSGT